MSSGADHEFEVEVTAEEVTAEEAAAIRAKLVQSLRAREPRVYASLNSAEACAWDIASILTEDT